LAFKSYAPVGAAQAGPVSVGSDYVVYGDSSGRLVRVGYVAGDFATTETAATVTAGVSSQLVNPVIGAGEHIYSISADGTLVVSGAATLSEEWRENGFFPVASSKLAQPALDVLRSGATPQCRGLGVLYVSSAKAGAATVTAVLVDSQGLEPAAPWPKFQRDNANSGNLSRPLDAWTCH
jgi:hypothetical protein